MANYPRAYQAYQQRNYDYCLKLLQEIKQNDTKKLDLLAQVHFQRKEYQEAYDIYQELLAKHHDDYVQERKENLTTLIVCSQLEQPGRLKLHNKDKLPTVQDIVDQVEIINIKDDTVSDLSTKSEPSKRLKRKKRTTKLPKNYNPDVAPDPERWLPRRDRKGGNAYRQKKRRQRQNIRNRGRAK